MGRRGKSPPSACKAPCGEAPQLSDLVSHHDDPGFLCAARRSRTCYTHSCFGLLHMLFPLPGTLVFSSSSSYCLRSRSSQIEYHLLQKAISNLRIGQIPSYAFQSSLRFSRRALFLIIISHLFKQLFYYLPAPTPSGLPAPI